MNRSIYLATATSSLLLASCGEASVEKQPNVIYVFADQWRAQSLGYAGDVNVKTPNLDKLASESVNFTHAISCTPVSTPYRASLMTGQYALHNGLFLNDVRLNPEANTIAKSYNEGGYNTAYVGKWHINGHGRSNYIEPEYRQGFEYYKVLECSHNYNKSAYYENNDETMKVWEGYDAFSQSQDVMNYITEHANDETPFMMVLSWGPPHDPYGTAPQKYLDMYADVDIELRPNVPDAVRERTLNEIRGYYAHITALDDSIGELQAKIKELGLEEDTIFVFTSDHGDMMGSQGFKWKQKPYDESIRVPFLLKYPKMFGSKGKVTDVLFNTFDIMPTLLDMCGLSIPESVDGESILPILLGEKEDDRDATLISIIAPFADNRRAAGGREYRGVRTKRYTYVRALDGPWLLFDNETDPYQMTNLVNTPAMEQIQADLEQKLQRILDEMEDEFLSGWDYIDQWGYRSLVDEHGTVQYRQYNK